MPNVYTVMYLYLYCTHTVRVGYGTHLLFAAAAERFHSLGAKKLQKEIPKTVPEGECFAAVL